jgi:hypothetical protein
VLSLKISIIKVERQRLKNHRKYFFFRNTRVILDTYVSKGTRKPIVKHISLKEHILCVKLDLVINIRFIKDTSYKIILCNLIINNNVCNTYQSY